VPDHRRLVADRVDAVQQLRDELGVGDVAAQEPVPSGVRRRRARAVGRGEEVVQHHDLGTPVGQEVGDV
jgi:hypothetical protein